MISLEPSKIRLMRQSRRNRSTGIGSSPRAASDCATGSERLQAAEVAAGATRPVDVRIWRKDRAGDWKLALDLLHPR